MALTGYQSGGKLFQKNLKHSRKRWKVDDRLWIPLFQRWLLVRKDRPIQIYLKCKIELIIWYGEPALGGRLIFVGCTLRRPIIRPPLKQETHDCSKCKI
jgi:hypothetical protein